jgi:hypothetical protein
MRRFPALAFIPAVALAATIAAAPWAPAAAQTPARIRGTIVKLDGEGLVVHARNGQNVDVTLLPNATVTAVSLTKFSDVKAGSFIGTAAIPQPDGTLKALEVHIFPESMRGTGEGFRPWDLGPNSTMTNGTVGEIAGTDGRSLTVKYKDGEKTVVVPPDVPVVQFEPGTLAQLTPGAHVVVLATKAADGALSAARVNVGKDGIDLPL